MPAYTTETRESGGKRQLAVALVLFVAAVSMAFLPTPRQQQIAAVLRGTVLRPFVVVQGARVDGVVAGHREPSLNHDERPENGSAHDRRDLLLAGCG